MTREKTLNPKLIDFVKALEPLGQAEILSQLYQIDEFGYWENYKTRTPDGWAISGNEKEVARMKELTIFSPYCRVIGRKPLHALHEISQYKKDPLFITIHDGVNAYLSSSVEERETLADYVSKMPIKSGKKKAFQALNAFQKRLFPLPVDKREFLLDKMTRYSIIHNKYTHAKKVTEFIDLQKQTDTALQQFVHSAVLLLDENKTVAETKDILKTTEENGYANLVTPQQHRQYYHAIRVYTETLNAQQRSDFRRCVLAGGKPVQMEFVLKSNSR